MSASLVGLSMTYAVPLIGLLCGLVTTFGEMEQGMVAVERILQYIELEGSEKETTTGVQHVHHIMRNKMELCENALDRDGCDHSLVAPSSSVQATVTCFRPVISE